MGAWGAARMEGPPMRIDGKHAVLHAHLVRLGASRAKAPEATGGAAAQEDVVALSRLAQEVQQVKDYLATLPEVRQDRVAELRARIERGEYHVSAEDLADAILASGALTQPDVWPR